MAFDWDWRIKAYDVRGLLLFETVHRGDASKWIELQVVKERMRRGEIASCEVVHLNGPSETQRIINWNQIK